MHEIDLTSLHALFAIASDQANPTERNLKRVHQLLDYMHINPNIEVHFYASDMILRGTWMLATCQQDTCAAVQKDIFSWVACLATVHQFNSTVIFLSH